MDRCVWRGLVVLAIATSSAAADPIAVMSSGGACNVEGLAAAANTLAPPAARPVTAAISTSRADGHVEATVSLSTADGTSARAVSAVSCADLVDSLALVLAMAAQTIPDDAPPPPTYLPNQTHERERFEDAPVANFAPRWSVLAGGAVANDLSPSILVGATMRIHANSLGLEARYQLPEQLDVSATGRVSVTTAALSLSPCHHIGALSLCGTASAGFIHGHGTGLADAQSATHPLVALGGRVAWTLPLTARLALRFHLEAEATLTTTRFDVDNMPVWTSDRFAVRGGTALVAHFP
ncbi:hypothetical protein BH11MYX2_BH11MYX2_34520 [soil metagenome]